MRKVGLVLVVVAALVLPAAAERRDPSKVRIVREAPPPDTAAVRPATLSGQVQVHLDPALRDLTCSTLEMTLGTWEVASQGIWNWHQAGSAMATGLAATGSCRYRITGIRPRSEPYSIFPHWHQALAKCSAVMVDYEPGSVQVTEAGQTTQFNMVVTMTCTKPTIVTSRR